MGNTAITTQKTERDSSLELLRIVAMLMIIAHHFACHGGFYFHANSIMLNRLWHKFIFMGGSLGNDIFVMLSGYFLINSKVLNLRRLFNLWARIFFYSVIIYSSCCLMPFDRIQKSQYQVSQGHKHNSFCNIRSVPDSR